MKRKNTTRNALFTSIIALLMCVSMLVGTTFAWFTDEVVTGMNTIAAGNLDVELLADGNQVDSNTKLFDDVTLWEPGVVVYENLQVANVGTLALQYQMSLNFGNENDLNGHKLSEVLQVAVIDKIADGADRATVLAAAKAASNVGELADFYLTGELEAKTESPEQTVVIFWAPNDNDTDNLYNVNNGQTVSDYEETGDNTLRIEFGINLQATQKMSESDSFGPDYDSLASAWDGIVGEVPEVDENGVITLTTGAELAAFAASVNDGTSYSGKTVKLGADINLGGKAWAPIGACNSAAYFQGTFDGQGHTIYNLSVDKSSDGYQYSTAGLFGWIDAGAATIKNVNLENATVMGSHWVGALVGYMTGTVENCSVNNSTVMGFNVNSDANGDKVGGLVGYMNSGAGKLDGNTVNNTKISGYRDVAGLAGAVATTNTVTNNKVENVEITYSNAHVGEIVSPKTAVTVDATNTATNVTITRVIIAYTVAELNDALAALSGDALSTDAVLQNCDEPSGVVNIPGDYTGTLTLKDSAVASVQAAGAADLVIVGNVAVKATEEGMSAITGTKLNIAGNGNLTATGKGTAAFGIGGMNTEEITISGVTVDYVEGGEAGGVGSDTKYYKDAPEGGAAIGSGKDGAVITLKNVVVTKAIGGSKAAAIGARYHVGVTVNIENSTIGYAEGGVSAAGIGGSRVSDDGPESGTTINIINSNVTAKGGAYGAGIGSGYDTHCGGDDYVQPLRTINIDGSAINATGGRYAAGVGTGYHNAALAGEIKNSTVTAASGEKWYKDAYTNAQDIGFGVVDPAREGKQTGSYIIYNGVKIGIPTPGRPVSSLAELKAALEAKVSNINLTGNIQTEEAISIDYEVSIHGNGNTVSRAAGYTGNVFSLGDNAKLTLADITVDGGAVWTGEVDPTLQRGTVNSGVTATGALVATGANAHIVLNNGAVLQNNAGANAVDLGTRVGATLTLDGGEIINNYSAAGAIWGGGAITVNSGKINGNHGGIGGAIRVVTNVGTVLTMNGGEMNHNKSDGVGGAIWAGSSSSNNVYVLNGGEMAYNYSPVAGGAMYAGYYETVKIGGNFKMHDYSAPVAGAIRFHNHASLVMTGGEIYDNGDNSLYLNNNSATITGGTISDSFDYSGGLGLTIGTADIDGVIHYNLSTNHNTAYLAAEFNEFSFTVEETAANFANFNFKPAAGYTYTAGDEAKLVCLNDGYETYWDAGTGTFRLQAK